MALYITSRVIVNGTNVDVSGLSPIFTKLPGGNVNVNVNILDSNLSARSTIPRAYSVHLQTLTNSTLLGIVFVPNDGRFPTLNVNDAVLATGKLAFSMTDDMIYKFVIVASGIWPASMAQYNSRDIPVIITTGLGRPVFVSESENRYEISVLNTCIRTGQSNGLTLLYVSTLLSTYFKVLIHLLCYFW